MGNNGHHGCDCREIGSYRLHLQIGAKRPKSIGKAQVEGNAQSQPARSESCENRNPLGRLLAQDMPCRASSRMHSIAHNR